MFSVYSLLSPSPHLEKLRLSESSVENLVIIYISTLDLEININSIQYNKYIHTSGRDIGRSSFLSLSYQINPKLLSVLSVVEWV